MTFRPPLCNVRHITEWVQQELICPGDWLGDWAIVHEEQMWWRWTAAHLLHGELLAGLTGDERLQPATQTTATTTRRQHRRNFSTRLISLLTSSLYYCGLKTCCMMYFKIQSLFVFMPLQRFWGNFFTFSSSSSSVTSWRPVLVNTLSISNFGTKVNMDWRMNWLDCGGQRFIIKRSKVCDLVIIQRHSSETPAWCVHGGVQPWCSNYNKLV